MKKSMILAMAVAALSFTACKKDRTCTCTVTTTTTTTTTNGSNTTVSTNQDNTTDVTVYNKAKKGAARANCLSYKTEDSNTSTFGSTTVVQAQTEEGSCSLK
jgi:uncharacterized phosphosugar-binding protein